MRTAALNQNHSLQHGGDEGYTREELVAELGASFLCADLVLTSEPGEDHAAYIQSWLKVLKNDKLAIVSAAAHAQSAADFLHLHLPVDLDRVKHAGHGFKLGRSAGLSDLITSTHASLHLKYFEYRA